MRSFPRTDRLINRFVMMDQGRKMMELSKQVLQKVSFDRRLFTKELIKARRWLGQHDQLVLKAWCLATFGHMYKDVILEVFKTTLRS
ncbi:MAG: hypothetical protein GFGODING_00071 [Flavobacteriales bacterium]|nr:hypothetical protein [Flavobacteriales bacterium]